MWLTRNREVFFRVCYENFQRAPLPPLIWENRPGNDPTWVTQQELFLLLKLLLGLC